MNDKNTDFQAMKRGYPNCRVDEVNAQPFYYASVFSGIGGPDLPGDWCGWENVFNCEWNLFGKRVLKNHWPNAINYDDITKTDFTIHRGTINLLTGGFPCQPYSAAGKRLGKADERHLWPQMLRAIREIQPPWVVGENVRGLITWNGGLVFNEVQTDLEAEGYEVLPFLLPASGVNAPHERYRVWFIAFNSKFKSNGGHNTGTSSGTWMEMERNKLDKTKWNESTNDIKPSSSYASDTTGDRRKRNRPGIEIEKGLQQRPEHSGKLAGRLEGLRLYGNATDTESRGWNDTSTKTISGREQSGKIGVCDSKQNATNPNGFGLRGESDRIRKSGFVNKNGPGNYWGNFPTQSPICSGNDGISSELVRQRIREDCMGLLSEKEIDKIISKADTEFKNEAIKAYGNAIVPHVFYQICKAIDSYEAQYGWR